MQRSPRGQSMLVLYARGAPSRHESWPTPKRPAGRFRPSLVHPATRVHTQWEAMAAVMRMPDTNAVRRVLESKREEFTAVLGVRDGIHIERAPDAADNFDMAVARETFRARLEIASHLLNEVTSALDRLHAGEHGRCEVCGNRIGKRRLQVLPWATRCVRCQAAIETSVRLKCR